MDLPSPPAPDGCCQGQWPALAAYTQRALIIAADAGRRNHWVELYEKRGYIVTNCSNPVAATAMLRNGLERFNLVVLDVFPSCIGSMELLKCAIMEMHLQVYGVSKVGQFWGPLDVEDLKTICNKSTLPESTFHIQINSISNTTTTNSYAEGNTSEETEQNGEHNNVQGHKAKKERLVWTEELHRKFEKAYNKLLPEDAVPKKILDLMNDARLTRENIASHLQKYRLILNEKQVEPHTTPPQTSITNESGKQNKDSESSWEYEYLLRDADWTDL